MAEKHFLRRGNRVYHFAFGWCKIIDLAADTALVDLEAKSVTYYVMGRGYQTFKRTASGNLLKTPTTDLLESDTSPPGNLLALKKRALNPSIVY